MLYSTAIRQPPGSLDLLSRRQLEFRRMPSTFSVCRLLIVVAGIRAENGISINLSAANGKYSDLPEIGTGRRRIKSVALVGRI
jgi:hypothetical protein